MLPGSLPNKPEDEAARDNGEALFPLFVGMSNPVIRTVVPRSVWSKLKMIMSPVENTCSLSFGYGPRSRSLNSQRSCRGRSLAVSAIIGAAHTPIERSQTKSTSNPSSRVPSTRFQKEPNPFYLLVSSGGCCALWPHISEFCPIIPAGRTCDSIQQAVQAHLAHFYIVRRF